MVKIFGFVAVIAYLFTFSAQADEEMGNENVQFVYGRTGLQSVTIVTSGDDAEKVFRALSTSFPNLVTKFGKFGLNPEIELPNIVCGLQTTSHGPGPVPATYQCYSTVFSK
jgi:hypothetical protein